MAWQIQTNDVPSLGNAQFEHEQGHIRKRQKVTRACDACKSRKKRCTGERPCAPCSKVKANCTYDATYSRGVRVPPSPSQPGDGQHTSPAISSPGTAQAVVSGAGTGSVTGASTIIESVARQGPGPIPALNTIVGSYETHESETTTESSINLDAGTTLRPPIHSDGPSRRMTPEPGEGIDGQYHGPSSAQSFLGRALRRLDRTHPQELLGTQQAQHGETDMAILCFGDAKSIEPDNCHFAWPEYSIASSLVHRYFEFCSPTYRYMHEPTVHKSLTKIYEHAEVPLVTRALILLIFASASVFRTNSFGYTVDASHQGWQSSEVYFRKAQQLLSEETGPPRLESVQARFATVQYLLASSRPNKALFTFGTMIQLLQAVGIHRRRETRARIVALDAIAHECHKRIFWCAFTLDKYLSIVMGRMPLLHHEDATQELPIAVNDEDLTADGAMPETPGPKRDCLLHATAAHAELGMILAKVLREQHRLPTHAEHSHLEAAVRRSEEIRIWQSKLTPILSGAIHFSSLIPSFRRQHSVLALGRYHAIMFITRPLLLCDLSNNLSKEQSLQYLDQLRSCIQAAKEAIELISRSGGEKILFPAFWYSQYITFHAISIIYIYIIQLSRHRIPNDIFQDKPLMNCKSLFSLAHTGQIQLAEATMKNAPVWRYSLILEGLSAETGRYVADVGDNNHAVAHKQHLSTNAHLSATNESLASHVGDHTQQAAGAPNQSTISSFEMDSIWANGNESLFDDLIAENIDNNLAMDFWPQFDNLPISYGFQ